MSERVMMEELLGTAQEFVNKAVVERIMLCVVDEIITAAERETGLHAIRDPKEWSETNDRTQRLVSERCERLVAFLVKASEET